MYVFSDCFLFSSLATSLTQTQGARMKKVSTDDETILYEDIKGILMVEVAALKALKVRLPEDVKRLVELTKIYAVLKDDLRADHKGGLIGD
jgi:hypothetical protein